MPFISYRFIIITIIIVTEFYFHFIFTEDVNILEAAKFRHIFAAI